MNVFKAIAKGFQETARAFREMKVADCKAYLAKFDEKGAKIVIADAPKKEGE